MSATAAIDIRKQRVFRHKYALKVRRVMYSRTRDA